MITQSSDEFESKSNQYLAVSYRYNCRSLFCKFFIQLLVYTPVIFLNEEQSDPRRIKVGSVIFVGWAQLNSCWPKPERCAEAHYSSPFYRQQRLEHRIIRIILKHQFDSKLNGTGSVFFIQKYIIRTYYQKEKRQASVFGNGSIHQPGEGEMSRHFKGGFYGEGGSYGLPYKLQYETAAV